MAVKNKSAFRIVYAFDILFIWRCFSSVHGWTEEKQRQHGSGNLQDLERFCMEQWSLNSCQVFCKLIRHYRRKLRTVILEKGGSKMYLIKGGT